jgi:hypothetical protein
MIRACRCRFGLPQHTAVVGFRYFCDPAVKSLYRAIQSDGVADYDIPDRFNDSAWQLNNIQAFWPIL